MKVFPALFFVSLANALTIEELVSQPISKEAEKLTGQELVDYLNKNQHFFEAEYSGKPLEYYKARVMNSEHIDIPEEAERKVESAEYDEEIPESYDARKEYPKCRSLFYVRDQSACGSCWAVSAASTFSDRACIQSKGRINTIYSDADILSCCGPQCGGCKEGSYYNAWKNFLIPKGVCSGGSYHMPYDRKKACKYYPFHPCGHHQGSTYYGECPAFGYPTPPCRYACDSGYWLPYRNDKRHAKSVYRLPNNETAIQKEILMNGPVQSGFYVYEDFHRYKKGIYIHTAGKREGGHAIKIIGWGVENGTKYWTIANSYNYDWGEKGHFRMIRGVNNCQLEELAVAGMIQV